MQRSWHRHGETQLQVDDRAQKTVPVDRPTAYFCTDDDASKGNCDGDFNVVTVPAFYGVMKGTGHIDVVVNPATRDRITKVTTAWLRWRQMADQTQKALFVGPDCSLCMDPEWVVQQKNDLM